MLNRKIKLYQSKSLLSITQEIDMQNNVSIYLPSYCKNSLIMLCARINIKLEQWMWQIKSQLNFLYYISITLEQTLATRETAKGDVL